VSTQRPLVLQVILLLALLEARAQESPPLVPRQTAEFWFSSSVTVKPFSKKSGQVYERKFFKRFRASGELGYRGNENLTDSKLLYAVLGFRYRFNKHLRVMLENRYNMRGPTNRNSFRQDVQVDLTTEVGRFGLGYRFTGQHEYEDVVEYRDILRNRVDMAYNTRKFPVDPYVAAESFTAMHYTGNMLIGMRYTLGAQWNLGNGRSLDAGLRHDREINLYDPLYRWIIAVSFDMDLD
jgi:hypothetical protein